MSDGLRKKFHWVATVADAETTKATEVPFETYWSPEHDGDSAASEVALAAAAQHTIKTQQKHIPISAVQVEAPMKKLASVK